MAKLHISQDDTRFWPLSLEDDDGSLTVISHQFPGPDHLIEDARELIEKGKVPNAAIVIWSAAAGGAQPRPWHCQLLQTGARKRRCNISPCANTSPLALRVARVGLIEVLPVGLPRRSVFVSVRPSGSLLQCLPDDSQ